VRLAPSTVPHLCITAMYRGDRLVSGVLEARMRQYEIVLEPRSFNRRAKRDCVTLASKLHNDSGRL